MKQISMDLSPSFIAGAAESFSDAQITFDRFHVVKLLNEAMNQVRIIERKEHDELKGCQNSSIYQVCQYGSRTLVWDCSFC